MAAHDGLVHALVGQACSRAVASITSRGVSETTAARSRKCTVVTSERLRAQAQRPEALGGRSDSITQYTYFPRACARLRGRAGGVRPQLGERLRRGPAPFGRGRSACGPVRGPSPRAGPCPSSWPVRPAGLAAWSGGLAAPGNGGLAAGSGALRRAGRRAWASLASRRIRARAGHGGSPGSSTDGAGLGQEAVAARLARGVLRADQRVARERDHRDVARGGVLLQAARGFSSRRMPGSERSITITSGCSPEALAQGLLAVVRLRDVAAVEAAGTGRSISRLSSRSSTIDYQRGPRTWGGLRGPSGITSVKVEPCVLRAGSSSRRPLCMCASRRETARCPGRRRRSGARWRDRRLLEVLEDLLLVGRDRCPMPSVRHRRARGPSGPPRRTPIATRPRRG